MAKKKEASKKEPAGEQEEDASTQTFFNLYNKKSKENEMPMCPQVTEEYNSAIANEDHIESVYLLAVTNY